MTKLRPALRAAPFAALLFAIPACSTSISTDHPAPQTAPQGDPSAAAVAQQQGQQKLAEERKQFLVGKALEDARRARRENNLPLAQALLMEANRRDPGNRDVERALQDLRREMGLPAGNATVFDDAMRSMLQIRQQRARALVTQMMKEGRELMDQLNFDLAIQKLRSAQLEIDAGSAMDWGEIEDQVHTLLSDAVDRRGDHDKEVAQAESQEILKRIREAEDRDRARSITKVNDYLEAAQQAFMRRLFKHAQQLASLALEEDVNNAWAIDLYNAAGKSLQATARDRYYQRKSIEYLKLQEAREDLLNPQTAVMRIDAPGMKRIDTVARQGASRHERQTGDHDQRTKPPKFSAEAHVDPARLIPTVEINRYRCYRTPIALMRRNDRQSFERRRRPYPDGLEDRRSRNPDRRLKPARRFGRPRVPPKHALATRPFRASRLSQLPAAD